MDYFCFTAIVTALVTFLPSLLYAIFFSAVSALSIPPFVYVMLLLLFCFLAMYGYGKAVTAISPHKPQSRAGLYAPLFVPLLWYLFHTGICNLLNDNGELTAVLIGFWGLHLFGVYTANEVAMIPGCNLWHSVLLWNLLYDAVLFLGFAAGEYFSSKKAGIKRKPFSCHKKHIAVFLSMIVLTYLVSEFMLFRQRENIVDSARPSYRFSYAGGYSSIDLSPYDVTNEENILAKLDVPASFTIANVQDMPIMDGAEAAYPVYAAFANACYANIAKIQEKAQKPDSDSVMPVQFQNTIYAYEKLISGEIDIFFGAKPSAEQFAMAQEAGVELQLTPIGKEAFVFFVNENNPVDNLTSEQLRAIYSGDINNWREVGGEKRKILAFQRPENSGSQTMMEYFMGDTPLRKPLQAEYESGMGDVIRSTAAYENSASAIGYSFRYYTTIMMPDSGEDTAGIKLLAIDGVYPDSETIRSDAYPYTTQLYAITTTKRMEEKSTIEPFLAWMTGPQGQQIVADTGYVSIN
ncbi:MAG: substrate-binding domain-containing protein [Clostridium sp.]|nr:substrate-binding domain-containing protein [Clostridium sp.]